MNILLIYPSLYRVSGLPVGLSSLATYIIQHGHNVDIFDTTFYPPPGETSTDDFRDQVGMSKKLVNAKEIKDNAESVDIHQDLEKLFLKINPEIVGVTLSEPTYQTGISLIQFIKKNIPKHL